MSRQNYAVLINLRQPPAEFRTGSVASNCDPPAQRRAELNAPTRLFPAASSRRSFRPARWSPGQHRRARARAKLAADVAAKIPNVPHHAPPMPNQGTRSLPPTAIAQPRHRIQILRTPHHQTGAQTGASALGSCRIFSPAHGHTGGDDKMCTPKTFPSRAISAAPSQLTRRRTPGILPGSSANRRWAFSREDFHLSMREFSR